MVDGGWWMVDGGWLGGAVNPVGGRLSGGGPGSVSPATTEVARATDTSLSAQGVDGDN